jgi:glycosyltransferase involved in cell wall biosynthesis
MDTSRSIVVVIPAYNEAAVVGQVISKIPAEIASIPVRVLLVDDGSTDGTAQVGRLAGAGVVRHLTNLGVGAATRTGFRAADALGADIVVTIDADGQHDPSEIEKLVDPIARANLDIVIGNRVTDFRGMPLGRLAANLVMNVVTFISCRRFVPDSQSGFKAISSDKLRMMTLSSEGYEICSEIIGEMVSLRLRYRFVPVRAVYTSYSRSKGQHFLNGVNVILELFSRMMRRV